MTISIDILSIESFTGQDVERVAISQIISPVGEYVFANEYPGAKTQATGASRDRIIRSVLMRRNRIDSAVWCYQIPPFVGMLMEQSNSFQRIQSPMEFVPERSLLLPAGSILWGRTPSSWRPCLAGTLAATEDPSSRSIPGPRRAGSCVCGAAPRRQHQFAAGDCRASPHHEQEGHRRYRRSL